MCGKGIFAALKKHEQSSQQPTQKLIHPTVEHRQGWQSVMRCRMSNILRTGPSRQVLIGVIPQPIHPGANSSEGNNDVPTLHMLWPTEATTKHQTAAVLMSRNLHKAE